MSDQQLCLDFYGATAVVKSSHAELMRWLKFDFSYFIVDTVRNPLVSIEATVGEPPWDIIPELVESMRSPEYVCFDSDSIRFVNYLGRALVRFDYRTETAQMYSSEPEFLYEKLYLLLLSRTGEILDRKGIHRVHGLGITVNQRAALFLMPSGGGKSTLALSLLKEPDVLMISEDTPLLDSHGTLFPFPLRLGVSRDQLPPNVPTEQVREFHRERWGTKYLLHIDYFREKIQSSPTPAAYLFSGKWINSNSPKIERIGRLSMFMTLMRDCVFGMGLPQVVEFFLTSNPGDLARKSGIALRRIYAIFRLILKSSAYRVLLSKDLNANRDEIMRFLREGTR
jgi:hypothetical protein